MLASIWESGALRSTGVPLQSLCFHHFTLWKCPEHKYTQIPNGFPVYHAALHLASSRLDYDLSCKCEDSGLCEHPLCGFCLPCSALACIRQSSAGPCKTFDWWKCVQKTLKRSMPDKCIKCPKGKSQLQSNGEHKQKADRLTIWLFPLGKCLAPDMMIDWLAFSDNMASRSISKCIGSWRKHLS